ncbi:SusE domain-containing protein [Winogradskyella sp. DF17]|uniref:SusE domain-containing protein n=2 Tax=Winogradskyella pelagia TaxID=2819984 RepID=A0ABS3SYW2_9FLAO|nr:SusE domain-containing protein [Winogradskyella sp. DF17]
MKMKRKISILLSSLFALFVFTACEDDSDQFTVTETDPVSLSELSIDMIELDAANPNNPAVTFNWTVADYGQPAEERYALEVSSDETFTNPVVPSTVNGNNTVTLSMGELNSAAGNAGLPPFEWNTLYARIVSSLGTQNGVAVGSNVITFQVFPFFNYPFKDYYLVGNATAADWNNNNNNPALFRDADNSNLYTYTGFFNSGEFKVLEVKGLWQPQWGTNDGASIDVNPGDTSDPGTFPNNNSSIGAAGYYTFTINFGNSSFSFEAFDESGATDYMSIDIEGSALTGPVSMTRLSASDSHVWYANSVALNPGDLAFSTDLGSTWGSETSFSGKATEGGSNIPVIVGDLYDVWFNDLTGDYIMIPLNL